LDFPRKIAYTYPMIAYTYPPNYIDLDSDLDSDIDVDTENPTTTQ